jgi:hypothetical protein
MQESYDSESVRKKWNQQRRGLYVGLAISVCMTLFGLVRQLAGESIDGLVMVAAGVIISIFCGVRLMIIS